MTADEWLALAVRAEVARTRADEAQERAALLEQQVAPLLSSVERFMTMRGRRPDFQDPSDLRILSKMVDNAGGAEIPWTAVLAAGVALEESGRLAQEAGRAIEAVRRAWTRGHTLLDWIGVSRESYERAVKAAMLTS